MQNTNILNICHKNTINIRQCKYGLAIHILINIMQYLKRLFNLFKILRKIHFVLSIVVRKHLQIPKMNTDF